MSPTKKVTVKIDLQAKRKRLTRDLNARARCLCCHLPLLNWSDHALLDELSTCSLYDGTDYVMTSNKVRSLCEHCGSDDSRVLEALHGAGDLPLAEWQDLFKHAVRLCVKGMRLD